MNKNKVMKKKKKGFTLIELIAVVAILAILAAVAVPRVIKYVDKSKRVAVQTEASTVYNAAEAAYNDGKLGETTSGKSNFDALEVSKVVKTLEGEDLLSNSDVSKLGTVGTSGTLGDLKQIIKANEASIQVDNNGVFQKVDNSGTTK